MLQGHLVGSQQMMLSSPSFLSSSFSPHPSSRNEKTFSTANIVFFHSVFHCVLFSGEISEDFSVKVVAVDGGGRWWL